MAPRILKYLCVFGFTLLPLSLLEGSELLVEVGEPVAIVNVSIDTNAIVQNRDTLEEKKQPNILLIVSEDNGPELGLLRRPLCPNTQCSMILLPRVFGFTTLTFLRLVVASRARHF